jgi:ABC-type oligopeptide transport system substrate-binding subunit
LFSGNRPRCSTASGTGRASGRRSTSTRSPSRIKTVQALFSEWSADYPTTAGFVVALLTCGGYSPDPAKNTNFSEFCDPAIDREIAHAEQLQTSEPAAAARLWEKVDRDLTDHGPTVTYGNVQVLELLSGRVGNYQYNPAIGTLVGQLWVR